MKVGDLISYTTDDGKFREVGGVLKLTPSGTKASVLWSTESVGIFFSIGDLERYPNNFKLVSK